MPNVYFAMNSRHRTSYKKGDQLFNSYGLRTNRFLLTNYGFAIRQNKYNSLGFKVFVNYTNDEQEMMRHVKILKLKKNKLSEALLQYLRANLIGTFKQQNGNLSNSHHNDLLVSTPVNLDFELLCISTGIGLVDNMLKTKFAT
jgi:hypothetical protein